MNSSTLSSASAHATWKRTAPRFWPSRRICWTSRKRISPGRDEGQPEQAEHADRRPVDGQAERARARAIGLCDPGQLTEGSEVGQARGPNLARWPALLAVGHLASHRVTWAGRCA